MILDDVPIIIVAYVGLNHWAPKHFWMFAVLRKCATVPKKTLTIWWPSPHIWVRSISGFQSCYIHWLECRNFWESKIAPLKASILPSFGPSDIDVLNMERKDHDWRVMKSSIYSSGWWLRDDFKNKKTKKYPIHIHWLYQMMKYLVI